MALAVYSGKSAYINGVPCTVSWGLDQAVAAARYYASCLGDASNTPEGTIDWTGRAAGIGAQPTLFPDGETFDFQGVANSDAGLGDLLSVSAEILPESVTINFNKSDGSAVTWDGTFGVNGEPTESATSATDTAEPSAHFGKDLEVLVDGASIEADEVAVQSASLVFRRPPSTFVRGGFVERTPGNLECDLSIVLASPRLVSIPAIEANALEEVILRLGSAGAPEWRLSKMRFLGRTGYTVQRGSPAPVIQYTVNAQWNAVDGAEQGYISFFDGAAETDYYGSGEGS